MKLNFWQWLGILLLIVGGGLWMYGRTQPKSLDPVPVPITQPATHAA